MVTNLLWLRDIGDLFWFDDVVMSCIELADSTKTPKDAWKTI